MADTGWDELTHRERAVLGAVERRLTNAEIADEFFISVRTVESHIAALRRKLGADSRAKLITAARARRTASVQVPQNSFVGRAGELAALRALLDTRRCVTVVGPAGSGKTRLALELAASDRRVPVIVELQDAHPDDVVSVIAVAIGLVADPGSDLLAACAVALQGQEHLLVLDNCDRVAAPAVEAANRLLAATPTLSVLGTSRTPVGDPDETVYTLPPLPLDDPHGGAVRLFLDRARSAAPTLELTAADHPRVLEVCRRLDGLPLAIELAAARLRHVTLDDLADRLGAGFGAIDRPGRGDRHDTLEAAFDWSWDLLSDEERRALQHLAALPGPFDLELADAVLGEGGGGAALRLMDRSMVVAVAAPGGGRFRLLESLKAYVAHRTYGMVAQHVRTAHAAYVATRLRTLAARARRDDSPPTAEAAHRLVPDCVWALEWTLDHDTDAALVIARDLAIVIEQYGSDLTSLTAVDRAARSPWVRERATARDLLDLGLALCYGNLDLVDELAALARQKAADPDSDEAAHHLAGYVDAYRGRSQAALAHLDIAEPLAEAHGHWWDLASALQARGLALLRDEDGDREAAARAFAGAMENYVRAGDAMHVNNTRYMMAWNALELGATDQALVWAEECVAYAQARANRHELGHALLVGARARGEVAEDDLDEIIGTFSAVGDLRCLTRGYLLAADHRPGAAGLAALENALDVARRAQDTVHQATALERIVALHWAAGERLAAATRWGELVAVVGDADARSRAPGGLLDSETDLQTAVAEGRARGLATR